VNKNEINTRLVVLNLKTLSLFYDLQIYLKTLSVNLGPVLIQFIIQCACCEKCIFVVYVGRLELQRHWRPPWEWRQHCCLLQVITTCLLTYCMLAWL